MIYKSKLSKEKLLEGIIDTLEKEIEELKKPNHYEMGNELLMRDIEVLKTKVKKGKEFNSKLQSELKEYRKLQSEVHSDIEKVWMYDTTLTKDLSPYQKRKRSEVIERVFYKIANEWIGGDTPSGLQKRTDPERWESLDDMDGSWTEDDIEKGHHLPF